jgi:hypothetical protein
MAFEVTEELNQKFDDRYVIVAESGCWVWTGENREGYGRFRKPAGRKDKREYIAAHRYSFARFNGAIPDGMCVCHSCDVPECVNPDHLWLGSHADNMIDRDAKGRSAGGSLPGEASPQSKLTAKIVIEIFNCQKPLAEIAKTYGLAKSHVSRIKNAKTWQHITKNLA